MKKFFLILMLMFLGLPTFAEVNIEEEREAQNRVSLIGTHILNANKIPKRMIFTYNKETKRNFLKIEKGYTKNQIIIYDGAYQYAANDDEIAAYLAREIYVVDKINGSFVNKFLIIQDPKFYEIIIDKRAVDYMVKAGYNPVAFITYFNKSSPEYRSGFFSRHNTVTTRIMNIYQYISTKYPEFLEGKAYLNNVYFQNFLLVSLDERQSLYYSKQRSGAGNE